MVLSPMYHVAPGRDTLDPWLLSTQVIGELHDTYGVVTQRTRKEQMCGKLEKALKRNKVSNGMLGTSTSTLLQGNG